jgi:hypothetical protein
MYRERVRPKSAPASAKPAVRPPTLVAHVLALQRVAGNAATRRVLARDTAPSFRLILADDGKTGVTDAIVDSASKHVKEELGRILKDSSDDIVKAGFDVQHVKSAPERKDEFTHNLGRNTFLIFLTRGRDAKHAVELVWKYIPMDESERKQREEHFKQHLASEGGVDMQQIDRHKRSQSVGFVGTDGPLQELKKNSGSADSAAALLGDVILHELGHALGHVKEVGGKDHDTGIMAAQLIIDAGAYQAGRFSEASAKIIRARVDELAKRLK